jgi:hypothetical protein
MSIINKEDHLKNELVEDDFLDKYVRWSLWIMALIVVIATITGQVESYNGLYIWFATHHVTGLWADWAPLAVDGITVVGELAVFAAIARAWEWKSRVIPWATAIGGFVASVAANVGTKVQFHSIPTDLTASVFPVVGALGIVIGLGVLKRVAKDRQIARDKKNALGMTQEEVAAQLLKDNQELVRKLEEAEKAASELRVVNISPPEDPYDGLKGLDVLIPPKEEVQPETQPIAAAITAEPEPVTAARLRGMRPDRGTIWQTGSFPAVTE